jgi:murein DD-endopeptidase MepM/ murein hydrolase activator NlpD
MSGIPTTASSPLDLMRTFSLEAQKGQPTDPKKVVQLAQEFEAMLMLQMVRQMRQSLSFDDEKEAGFGNETMTDTIDIELSRYLARAGGIGLGKMVEQSLTKQLQGASPAADSTQDGLPLPAPATALPTGAPAALPLASPLNMPLDSKTTSGFGWRNDPLGQGRKFHAGVDLRAAYGTAVPAAASGEVTFAGDQGGYGTTVVVQHEDGLETRYAHLSSMDVQAGDRVEAGQSVGRVGNSGRSTAPHLHFEVRRHGQQVDPAEVTGSRSAAFKFVSEVDDSLHERMLPGGTLVPLTDDPGVDDEDPGRKAR